MAIRIDIDDRLILVEAPATTVEIQELVRAIRAFESERLSLLLPSFADATGKQELSPGKLVGLTLLLRYNWRIKFEDRPGPATIRCFITAGNLTAENDYDDDPIAASEYVSTTIEQSTSAALILSPETIVSGIQGRPFDPNGLFP
jgi:hypothetical protein